MSKLKQYKMFIDGEWVDSESKKTFETLNPENNEPWAVVPEASTKDVNRAVKAAQKAFEGEWPKLLPRDRAKFLRAIGDGVAATAPATGAGTTEMATGGVLISTASLCFFLDGRLAALPILAYALRSRAPAPSAERSSSGGWKKA